MLDAYGSVREMRNLRCGHEFTYGRVDAQRTSTGSLCAAATILLTCMTRGRSRTVLLCVSVRSVCLVVCVRVLLFCVWFCASARGVSGPVRAFCVLSEVEICEL